MAARGLFWFRSELRLRDNRGLAKLCSDCGESVPEIPRLARETRADVAMWNRDYSPFARDRDERVRAALLRALPEGLAQDAPDELPTAGEAAARRRLEGFLDGPLRHYARDRSEFRALEWERDDAGFNRARMIVASFLTKDLGVDWRRGEAFFCRSLVDGDPASDNGGWQGSASTGTDAQPFFRSFDPVSQGQRYDPDGRYVRRFVPELEGVPDAFVHRPWDLGTLERPRDSPEPIAEHAERRELALARYRAAREDAAP